MKKRMILIGIVLLLVLAISTTASAHVVRTPFTAVETLIEYRDLGEWTYPGGNQHFRGMVEYLRVDSESDLMAGYNTIVANANLDANGYGVVWGTNVLEVDAYDGHWAGPWVGQIDENGMTGRMEGQGYGDLSGYVLRGTFANGVLEGMITQLPNP